MITCQSLTFYLQIINRWIGKSIAWLSLFIVLLTFIIVVLRYGFNIGWISLQESVNYLFATLFLSGFAYTLQNDGHVRVDIFYQNFSARAKAWVNLIGMVFLLLPVAGFILYICKDFVLNAWQIHETSPEPGGLAYVYLLKTLMLIMPVLLLIEALAQICRKILILRGIIAPEDAYQNPCAGTHDTIQSDTSSRQAGQ